MDRLDYLRQSLDRLPTRTGKPAHRERRMAGSAVPGPTAQASRAPGTFRRRVFWLLPHDRDSQPEGLYAIAAPGRSSGSPSPHAVRQGVPDPRARRAARRPRR
ncbi:DUF6009 family protein [Streptomyces sp. NBC_01283]|uniref:DUF6009 family protein n=1 Tax=Streptomyces sp. NBC_01283 TaxID=2903812 RepID=UPI00352ECA66|nr:DUF6009 family protein [Streptomyces sp. NBC_01283]WSL21974.1 DUF6009 family protein [Streptomyces sp. NBC_01283]